MAGRKPKPTAVKNLEDAGFTMVPFGQGFASMSTPTKELYRLLMEG